MKSKFCLMGIFILLIGIMFLLGDISPPDTEIYAELSSGELWLCNATNINVMLDQKTNASADNSATFELTCANCIESAGHEYMVVNYIEQHPCPAIHSVNIYAQYSTNTGFKLDDSNATRANLLSGGDHRFRVFNDRTVNIAHVNVQIYNVVGMLEPDSVRFVVRT